ncbi:MAG: formate/nitrite transporter, partial [Microbacterium sp.]|nr:formate/nitrite transporter [Microbacterium sp.]
TTWADFARNLTWVGLGNLVGGALVVGLAYVVVAGPALPAGSTSRPQSVRRPRFEEGLGDIPSRR